MEILLINPPQIPMQDFDILTAVRRGYPAYPPNGLGHLVSSLKKHGRNDLELFDCHLEGMLKIMNREVDDKSVFMELLEQKLRMSSDVKVVGLTIMFSSLFENTAACLKLIREIHPEVTVIVGGVHATMATESLYGFDEIDYILSYEGEYTFPQFLDYHLDAKGAKEEIQGLHYRVNGEFVGNAGSNVTGVRNDLEELVWADWNAMRVTEYYKVGRFGGAYALGNSENTPFAPIMTTRGCRAECSFCTVHNVQGRNVRMRSPKNVVDEIEYLNKELGIKFLEILDDDFTYSRQRSLDICNEIIKRKLDIVWTAKNGLIACSLNRELIEVFYESGCRYIQIGVESGNKEILKWIRKPLSIPKLLKVREIFQDFPEIYLAGYFMLGFPQETKDQMLDTYKLALQLELDWCAITMAQPLPSSRMYETFIVEGIFEEDDIPYEDLKFFHSTLGNKHMTRREILDMWYEFNIGVNFINNKNLRNNNLDRAIRDFKHVGYEIAPGHAMSVYCLGQAYYKKGEFDQAQACFDEAKAITEKDEEWRKWFNYFQVDFNDPDGFIKNSQLIAERFGSSPEISIDTYNNNLNMDGSALPKLI